MIAAAMSVLGFTHKHRQPTKFPLPTNIAKQSRAQQLEYLKKAASLIVDKFVFNYNSVITSKHFEINYGQKRMVVNGKYCVDV